MATPDAGIVSTGDRQLYAEEGYMVLKSVVPKDVLRIDLLDRPGLQQLGRCGWWTGRPPGCAFARGERAMGRAGRDKPVPYGSANVGDQHRIGGQDQRFALDSALLGGGTTEHREPPVDGQFLQWD